MKNTYRIFVLRPEGKTIFGLRWYRQEDTVTMDLKETG
jgi:hypothetical protein